jgi:ABC-type transport system substrate-binding protein
MLSRRFVLVAAMAVALAAATPVAQADAAKTLRVAFPVAETGFDPQAAGDIYSNSVNRAIFDPLYRYDYLARPYKLVPNTADGMPQITDDGKTWTIHVRRGIYFADDPVFKGKRRELTAADYVFAIKRILDPRMRSNSLQMVEGRFVGADALIAKARETGRFDYDAPLEGLQAVDRYTLRFKLAFADYELLSNLTTTALSAVAREVVDAYADGSGWVMANPVGTGPYRLKDWRRGQRIVLEANPGFRDERYPAPASDADQRIAKGLSGRKLPLVARVEISIIEEAQPRLLAFRSGALDYVDVPSSLAQTVLDGATLKPEFADKGVRLQRQVEPALGFYFFNMDDPVVGGYTPDRIALRRAIVMSQDRRERIRVLSNGQAEIATQMIPPPVPGHSPALAQKDPYDPAAARALLDKFGYRDRDGDGYREAPDGKRLVLVKGSTPTAADRAANELWKKHLDAVGLRTEFFIEKWPELNKRSEAGQLMIWNLAWIAGFPDADNFYSPLYSRNIGLSNDARQRLPEYDKAYEAMRALPEGPERAVQYRRMNELIAAYAPWMLDSYSYQNQIVQPRVRGMKLHPFLRDRYMYYDVAP